MTVEVASYIADLDTNYPAFDDMKDEGDDHIRLVKTVLKSSFPNLERALASTQAKNGNFTVSTVDAYGTYLFTAALDAQLPSAAVAGNGFMAWFKATSGNSTLTPFGAELVNGVNSAVTVLEGDMGWVVCDGTGWHTGFVGTVSIAAQVATAVASAAAASTSETNAATSETNAAASAAAASTSETNAGTSASNASTSEANALTSANNAATSESNASTSASNASTSASNASTSASNASTSASNASTSETNAAASEAAAAASYDSFDDRYLGAKASDPTLDNDGDPLLTGALYWNTTVGDLRFWDGAAWQAFTPAGPTDPWTRTSTATSKTIASWEHVSITAAGQTISFPPSPSEGDEVRVSLYQAATGTTLNGNGGNFYGAVTVSTLNPVEVGITMGFIWKDGVWRLL